MEWGRYSAEDLALVLRKGHFLLFEGLDFVGEGKNVQRQVLVLIEHSNEASCELLANSVTLLLVCLRRPYLQQSEERKYERCSRHVLQHRDVYLFHATMKTSQKSQLYRSELCTLLLSRRLDLEGIRQSQIPNLGQIRRIDLNHASVENHCVQILESHLFVTKLNSSHCQKYFCCPPSKVISNKHAKLLAFLMLLSTALALLLLLLLLLLILILILILIL